MLKIFTFLITLTISTLANSAHIEVGTDRHGTVTLYFSDKIELNDAQKFFNTAESWRKQGFPIQLIVLNSTGGNVLASRYISEYILRNKISTVIPNGALCASACVNIFLSGTNRIADIGSQIIVHRAGINNRDSNAAKATSIDINDFYRSMNVPDDIRIAMIDTPPNEYFYLSDDQKQRISRRVINYDKATTLFNRDNAPKLVNTIPKNSKQLARQLNKEAINLIWNNNFSVAISKLEQAKNYNPADAEVLGNLGFAYQKAGDLINAQINFTASLKLAPKRGATWGNLADVLADTGDIDWAIQAFVNYWNYSKNKQAATDLFYTWMNQYPNTGRDIAVRRAMQILGL